MINRNIEKMILSIAWFTQVTYVIKIMNITIIIYTYTYKSKMLKVIFGLQNPTRLSDRELLANVSLE